MKPVVAIIGRPNTGKSTLFNRITRSREAIVEDVPGVTRDCKYKDSVYDDVCFTLVDTGGLVEDDGDDLAGQIRRQAESALKDADAVILLFDGKSGPLPFDADLVRMTAKTKKPLFYAVNKIDGQGRVNEIYDFYRLGVSKLYPVSAAHGFGVSDLLDDLVKILPRGKDEPEDQEVRVAIVGRPNVGKSSLLNRITGGSTSIVSDIPGTTRDSIDTRITLFGQAVRVIDTAGIRKKSRTVEKVEKFSVIKALKSLDRCHIALVTMDASAGVTEQDIRILGYACERGRGVVILLNKWDLVDKGSSHAKNILSDLKRRTAFASYAPVLTVSAVTGTRVSRIFKVVFDIFSQYDMRISTGRLNRIIEGAIASNPPPVHRGRRIKFYYAAQVKRRPPTIVCFVNFPDAVHFSYSRYLVNRIRLEAGLDLCPLRIRFRKREGDRFKRPG